MAFEVVVLLSTVGLPAALAGLGWAAAGVLPKDRRERATEMLAPIFGAAAVWLSAHLRNGFEAWPVDGWLRVPLASALIAAVGVATPSNDWRESRWIARLVAVLAAIWLILPSGDGYADLAPSLPGWQLSMTLAVVLGWWGMEQIDGRNLAVVWAAWIVLMIAGTILIAQSFAKLAEIMLSVGTVFLMAGWIAYAVRCGAVLRTAAGPTLFAFAASVSHGQFNSFIGLPDWLSVLAMAGPACVCLAQLLLGSCLRNWIASALVWCLALGVATTVVWYSLAGHDG